MPPKLKKHQIRFWDKVNIRTSDECWLWMGGLNNGGYGNFWTKNKVYSAHCVSFELTYGPIPVGLKILHSCDNRPCVNPRHLSLGTLLDNNQDTQRKGRMADQRGEANPRSKLTDINVLAIRQLAKNGFKFARIAEQLHLNPSVISRIVNRKKWNHI